MFTCDRINFHFLSYTYIYIYIYIYAFELVCLETILPFLTVFFLLNFTQKARCTPEHEQRKSRFGFRPRLFRAFLYNTDMFFNSGAICSCFCFLFFIFLVLFCYKETSYRKFTEPRYKQCLEEIKSLLGLF